MDQDFEELVEVRPSGVDIPGKIVSYAIAEALK